MKLLIGVILFCSLQSVYATDDPSRLALSEIMYYRFQDNNFDAIASYLDSADRSLQLSNNDKSFIASVYLNYDIHSQAQDMLNLLIHNESADIRNASWFYLGKLHYRNKRIKSAVETFSKVDGILPPEMQEIKHIMYGIMAYNDAKYDIALEEFNKVPETSQVSLYVKYNLALASFRQKSDADKNAELMQQLIGLSGDKKYPVMFTDLIYITSGYQFLEKQQYEKALEQLGQVSADGYYASRALQGMVYASYLTGDHEKALNLAVKLLDMTVGNESVHYAYSIIPLILQKLGRDDKAMAFFQYSVEFFDRQRVKLEAYMTDINKGEFDQYLLDVRKVIAAEEWLQDPEMSRLMRYISTLDEWRDAVYKYEEMLYLGKRLDDAFYELLAIDADVGDDKQQYKNHLKRVSEQKTKVQKSIEWHQYHARYFMTSELTRQRDGIVAYLARARFALARYYDEQDIAASSALLNEQSDTKELSSDVQTGKKAEAKH